MCQDWDAVNAKSLSLYEKGEYKEAIIVCDQALSLAESKYGIVSNQYITSLSNKAYAESAQGDYLKALTNYRTVVSITFQLYTLPHVSQIDALHEVAKTHMTLATYDSSAHYIAFARYLYSAVYEQNKAHYDTAFFELASAYFKINSLDAALHQYNGQLDQAISMLEEQVQLIKTFYPDDYSKLHDYQVTINNLSNYNVGALRMEEAKKYALEYYSLVKNNYDTLDLIHAYQNLGNVYRYLDEYDSTIFYWDAALALLASSSFENTYIHTAVLNNLGEFYISIEEYVNGLNYLNASIEIQKSKEALNPSLYSTTLFNLAEGYRWSEDYATADKLYDELITQLLEDIIHNFTYLSDNEKMSFYKTQLSILDSYTSFALEISGLIPLQKSDKPYINKNIPGKLYDLQLTTKAIILNASKRMKNSILSSNDTTLIYIYSLWEERKNKLAQELINEHTTTDEINQLKAKIEENEKWLTSNSRSFRSGFTFEKVPWQEVQQSLKPGEASVEIIRLVGGLAYGALILTPETKEQPVFSLIMSTGSKYLEKQSIHYYQNSILYKSIDTLSYQTFWQPIIDSIKNNMAKKKMPKRIYISNDGIYNQINVNTLYNPATKKYVLDETQLVIVSNTKDLLINKKNIEVEQKRAALFGQPTFSSNPTTASSFPDLPGTGKEVQLINETLSKAKWNTTVYTEKKATEGNLKQLNNINVLHLASHGYFDPQANGENNSLAETMIRSGIVLAGVSDTTTRIDDGLLTAYEVISLNLDSTVLVVLSACETGKGVDNYGEGVYGLQRALHVAGAENIIMSLWKVDDQATQKLMVNFYTQWIRTNDMRKAFEEAQKTLRKEFPSPYYWGAFVLTGK